MTTLSIHPVAYLRDHVDFAHMIKKLLRLVVLTGFTLFLVGGLYSTLDYTTVPGESDVLTQAYMNAFPTSMPAMVLAPVVSIYHITF